MKHYNIFYQANNQLNIKSLVERLLPHGRIEGCEYVALNPTRFDNRLGSFRINLHTGRWADFATNDKGGDIVSLYAYLRALTQHEAASDLLGVNSGYYKRSYDRYTYPTPTKTVADVGNKENQTINANTAINEILNSCIPPENSLVENYLKNRGFFGRIPSAIVYYPRLYHTPSKQYHPAMVAAVTKYPDNKLIGLHRTYLKDDDSDKANIEPNKMMLGQVKGGAVMFKGDESKLIITEGIETALSVYLATGFTTWAALSASNMVNLELPILANSGLDGKHDIIIAADGDNTGKWAAELLAKRLIDDGYCVAIASAPAGKDFNDLLKTNEVING